MSKKIIIVGASAAGISALHTLRKLSPEYALVCISQEKELPYNKCFLADYFSGIKKENEIFISPITPELQHQFLLGYSVTHINPQKKIIILSNDQELAYDKLFLGLGSSQYVPPIALINTLQGIFNFHTLADISAIKTYINERSVKRTVIIGAGLSGLECADSLQAYGIETTLVEMNGHVLPSLLPKEPAQFIESHMKKTGITLIFNTAVKAFEHEDSRVTGVLLADGRVICADMVICATGLRANSDIARQAGIITNYQGILVDEHLQTNFPDIFAGGDAILVKDQITHELSRSCMWPDAMMQGMFAAYAMAGKPRAYPGTVIIGCSAFFGLKFATYGMKNRSCADDIIIRQGPDFYHEYLLQNGLLIGFALIGNTHNFALVKRLLLTRQPASELL